MIFSKIYKIIKPIHFVLFFAISVISALVIFLNVKSSVIEGADKKKKKTEPPRGGSKGTPVPPSGSRKTSFKVGDIVEISFPETPDGNSDATITAVNADGTVNYQMNTEPKEIYENQNLDHVNK